MEDKTNAKKIESSWNAKVVHHSMFPFCFQATSPCNSFISNKQQDCVGSFNIKIVGPRFIKATHQVRPSHTEACGNVLLKYMNIFKYVLF